MYSVRLVEWTASEILTNLVSWAQPAGLGKLTEDNGIYIGIMEYGFGSGSPDVEVLDHVCC